MRLPKIVCLVLGLALVLSLLGGCQFRTTGEVLQPPEVLNNFPLDGAEGVQVGTDIQILFSRPMDKDTTAQALSILPKIDHKVFWEEDSRLVVIHPLVSWGVDAIHEVTITAEARSEDGLCMEEDYSFSFHTEATLQPPVVIFTAPPDDAGGVQVGTDIQILFSRPMDKDTTAQALIIFPKRGHEVFWEDDGRLMMVHPLESWEILTNYEVTITAEARSEDGLYMEEDHALSFITGGKLQPPVVLATFPPHGYEIVPGDTYLQVMFSKPMDKDATAQALTIIPEHHEVFPKENYEIFWEEDGRLMIIHALENWISGIFYKATFFRVTITGEARSKDGLCIEEDYTFFFRIDPC